MKKVTLFAFITIFSALPTASAMSGSARISMDLPTDKVHVFYYTWYANPEIDKAWKHWNHPTIESNPNVTPLQRTCPDDIAANFYPELGLYSSMDPNIIDSHMKMIKQAGSSVIVTTWWGPGHLSDRVIPLLLDGAEDNGIKIAFHIEPYRGRIARSTDQILEDIKYIIDNYGDHPATYKPETFDGRPVFYYYDVYLDNIKDWKPVLKEEGEKNIRGTKYDSVIIGLLLNKEDIQFIKESGMDGFYTYFAVHDTFSWGANSENWNQLSRLAKQNNLIFIPSVGPGYNDLRVRRWNKENVRGREQGKYYDRHFKRAIKCDPPFISITSFNEWHEGTIIEPAVPKKAGGVVYDDYLPHDPEYYLNRTRYWTKKYLKQNDK